MSFDALVGLDAAHFFLRGCKRRGELEGCGHGYNRPFIVAANVSRGADLIS